MILLLDASVLIPLLDEQHLLHAPAHAALRGRPATAALATCAITQLALLRYLMRFRDDLGIDRSLTLLQQVTASARHRFLAQDCEPARGRWFGVIGHAQVTDAYLADLARAHHAKLLTADRGLAALHHDVAELI